MILDYRSFKERLEQHYYNMILEQNIAYLKEHGVGPYHYNGRFADRVVPYFDAGYWMQYYKWLESEHHAVCNNNDLRFLTKEDATLFKLRWL